MSFWWIMFYGIALALLVSVIMRQKALAKWQNRTVQSGLNHQRLMPIWLHQTITLFSSGSDGSARGLSQNEGP
jgi:hypothetical protein